MRKNDNQLRLSMVYKILNYPGKRRDLPLRVLALTHRFTAPKPVDNSRLGIKVMPWLNIQEAIDAVVSRLVSALMSTGNAALTFAFSAPLSATSHLNQNLF